MWPSNPFRPQLFDDCVKFCRLDRHVDGYCMDRERHACRGLCGVPTGQPPHVRSLIEFVHHPLSAANFTIHHSSTDIVNCNVVAGTEVQRILGISSRVARQCGSRSIKWTVSCCNGHHFGSSWVSTHQISRKSVDSIVNVIEMVPLWQCSTKPPISCTHTHTHTHQIYCQNIYTIHMKNKCNGRLPVQPRPIYASRL